VCRIVLILDGQHRGRFRQRHCSGSAPRGILRVIPLGWDAAARRLDIRLGSRTVTMWVGKTTAKVNGSSTAMSTAPAIIGGRTMIPLRFVAENLGCLVGWDQPTKGVTLVYGG
jgi:hypothetical protein